MFVECNSTIYLWKRLFFYWKYVASVFFENQKGDMKSWFWKTEHPENLMSSEMEKVFQLRLKSNDQGKI